MRASALREEGPRGKGWVRQSGASRRGTRAGGARPLRRLAPNSLHTSACAAASASKAVPFAPAPVRLSPVLARFAACRGPAAGPAACARSVRHGMGVDYAARRVRLRVLARWRRADHCPFANSARRPVTAHLALAATHAAHRAFTASACTCVPLLPERGRARSGKEAFYSSRVTAECATCAQAKRRAPPQVVQHSVAATPLIPASQRGRVTRAA